MEIAQQVQAQAGHHLPMPHAHARTRTHALPASDVRLKTNAPVLPRLHEVGDRATASLDTGRPREEPRRCADGPEGMMALVRAVAECQLLRPQAPHDDQEERM
ncbi:hypothetical protein D623_10016154 [Myotis brandtii]|uniref:Uncharacterized protein n=1 Tax=Myotis brandtii TaxID=109478 RepID=S7MRC1_MYOBR|nr:hypothetical protein D623_10016154 [Myotis brandtii]